MKRINIITCLALILFCLTSSTVSATNDITINVNGRNVFLDVKPFIENNRVMVPMRFPSEALGADVTWDGTEEKITAVLEDTYVEMWIGNKYYRVNNETIEMDVAPFIKGNRTIVPLRFISEGLGATVEWLGATNTVNITTDWNYGPPHLSGYADFVDWNKVKAFDDAGDLEGKKDYFDKVIEENTPKEVELDRTGRITDKEVALRIHNNVIVGIVVAKQGTEFSFFLPEAPKGNSWMLTGYIEYDNTVTNLAHPFTKYTENVRHTVSHNVDFNKAMDAQFVVRLIPDEHARGSESVRYDILTGEISRYSNRG